MEDLKGDDAAGCITMPIKCGLDYSTRFIMALASLVVLPLIAVTVILFWHHYVIPPLYITGALILPIIIWSLFLGRKYTVQHYHNASTGIKLIMMIGICSLLIYHFILVTNSA